MSRNLGASFKKENIYEIWGDVVENAADDALVVINTIHANLADYFKCEQQHDETNESYSLIYHWGDFEALIEARPFGAHLDVYGVLVIHRNLLADPNPLMRIANLEVWERRDLQIFQTLLKHAFEEALVGLEEGRLYDFS